MSTLPRFKRKAEDREIGRIAKRIRIENANFFETGDFENLFPSICESMPWDLPTLFFGMRFVSHRWRRLVDAFFEDAKKKKSFDPHDKVSGGDVLERSLSFGGGLFSLPRAETSMYRFEFSDAISKKLRPVGFEGGDRLGLFISDRNRNVVKEEWMLGLCSAYGYGNLALTVFSDKIGRMFKDLRAESRCYRSRIVGDPQCCCTKVESKIEKIREDEFVVNVAKTARAMLRMALWLGMTEILDGICGLFYDAMTETVHRGKIENVETYANLVECSYWNDAFYGLDPYRTVAWLWHHLGVAYDDYSTEEAEERSSSEVEGTGFLFRSKASLSTCLKFNKGLQSIIDPENTGFKKSVLSNWRDQKYYWTVSKGKTSYTIVKFPFREGVPIADHYRLHCFLSNVVYSYFIKLRDSEYEMESFVFIPGPTGKVVTETVLGSTVTAAKVTYPRFEETVETFRKILKDHRFYYTSKTIPFASHNRSHMTHLLDKLLEEIGRNDEFKEIWRESVRSGVDP
jgi:hypothetical protein